MSSITGPVVPRRRLAAELRRLRTEAGLTLEAVADELIVRRSKLSRLEKGQGSRAGMSVIYDDLMRRPLPPTDSRQLVRSAPRRGISTDLTRVDTRGQYSRCSPPGASLGPGLRPSSPSAAGRVLRRGAVSAGRDAAAPPADGPCHRDAVVCTVNYSHTSPLRRCAAESHRDGQGGDVPG